MLKLLGMSKRKAITLGVLLSCLGLFVGWQVYHDWTETIFMTAVVGITAVVLFVAWRLESDDELLAEVRRNLGINTKQPTQDEAKEMAVKILLGSDNNNDVE